MRFLFFFLPLCSFSQKSIILECCLLRHDTTDYREANIIAMRALVPCVRVGTRQGEGKLTTRETMGRPFCI